MLNALIKRDILELLGRTAHFSMGDFTFSDSSDNSSTTLIIRYSYDTKYYFRVAIPKARSTFKSSYSETQDFKMEISVAPGEISDVERKTVVGKSELFDAISVWLDDLWKDLMVQPVHRAIDEQRAFLDDLYQRISVIPDDVISKDEAAEFRKKLAELEARLIEHYKDSISDKATVDEAIGRLHVEIESLTATISVLRKQSWLKSLFARVVRWTADPKNKPALEAGANVVKAFLPSAD